MLLTLAILRDELREAMLQASRLREGVNDIHVHRAMLREELAQCLTTMHADVPKGNGKESMAQRFHRKDNPDVVNSSVINSRECCLGDIGIHTASRQLADKHANDFDPAFVQLPGEMDQDDDMYVVGQSACIKSAVVSSACPARSSTTDLDKKSSLDDTEANFPNILRLSMLRSSEGTLASNKGSERRRSIINKRRRSSVIGIPSRQSFTSASRRRDSVDSQRSVESTQTRASIVSRSTVSVCRANSDVSSVELPLATRRPSYLNTRLDLDDNYESLPPPRGVEWLVYHPYFDLTIAILIVLNGLSIGVQTDCMARAVTEKVPSTLRAIEIFFCVVFTLELSVRIVAERCFFFIGVEWGWNLFDCCIVVLQIFEEIMGIIASADSDQEGSRTNFSFMRVLRILRLIRIVRIVRVLRFIGELRTIVTSIASSMKHLLWTVMLLLLMIYTISVYFTQLVLDHRLGNASSDLSNLIEPWGSLGRSALTLFGSISGGIDWEIAVVPLIEHISVLLAPLFCLYIAFAILALMNVVTGVFVENAIDSANRDKERYLVQTVRELFEKADLDQSGVISWREFESQLLNPELKTLLQSLGIDQVSAKGLFKLLDIDNSGFIDANELLTGTLRLRGEARSIDLAALIYENRRTSRRVHQALSKMHDQLATLSHSFQTLTR